MIILNVTVTDDVMTDLKSRYKAAHKRSTKGMVEDYHREVFPRHFFNSNRTRYRLKPRTQFYLRKIKPKRGVGTGRYVDLVLKGVSRRRMMRFKTVRFADGGNTVVLRMEAPWYFTTKMQGQPDKVSEVTQVNSEDMQKIDGFYKARMKQELEKIRQKKTRKI